jgi:hypothetical protein
VRTVRLFSDFAHHGNAVPAANCRFVHSEYDAGQLLPATFTVINADGTVHQRFPQACRGYHGFSDVGDHIVTGCASNRDGAGHLMVLRYNAASDKYTLVQPKYPNRDPNNTLRVGTVWSSAGLGYAIANYGNIGILRVDPLSDRDLTSEDLLIFPLLQWPSDVNPARACIMDLQRGGSHRFVVSPPSGFLFLYDSADFEKAPIVIDLFPELRASLKRSNYSCAGQLERRAVVGSRFAFVYRRAMSTTEVMLIDLETGQVLPAVTIPDGLITGINVSMIDAVPTPTTTKAAARQCLAAAEAGESTGLAASAGSGDGEDNKSLRGAVIGLSVALVVLAVIVAIVVVVLVRSPRKRQFAYMGMPGKAENGDVQSQKSTTSLHVV